MHGSTTAASDVWGIPADVFAGWGQWAGAMGSLAAVVVALWIAIRDGRQRHREQQDREASQARTVTGEVRIRQFENSFFPMSGGARVMPPSSLPVVAVENHGVEPILDVRIEAVTMRFGGGLLEKWRLRDEHPSVGDALILASVIGGQNTADDVIYFDELSAEMKIEPHACSVTFTFADARGLTWRRVNNGPPQRVLDKPRSA